MATNRELEVQQKTVLFQLLRIKKANSGISIKELDETILAYVSAMTKEDVAWVEKQVAKL